MMNNDNAITVETKLYGFIAEEAHSNHFSAIVNKLFKENSVNAMVIPMNIRFDDAVFTLSQMRSSKLNGAVISSEYQEMAFSLLDSASSRAQEAGYCDCIRIENAKLIGDLIMPRALEKFAECNDFEDDIALRAMCHYFYELTTGENDEKR
jgi:shikimate 5-dehydrogenase